MKIYNKKEFTSGVSIAALGVLNLGNSVTDSLNGILLTVLLLVSGFTTILKSLSQKWAREDQWVGLDERNCLIELKSKSKSLQLTRTIAFVLMLVLLIAGEVFEYESLIMMSNGLALMYVVSELAECFTYMYYETKN